MTVARLLTFIVPSKPSYEWHDVSYLRPAGSNRGATISLFLILWIAVADLCWSDTNLSVLYFAPFILLARFGGARPLWRTAAVLVALTYAVYFLKNTINPLESGATYLNYRLINRTFVALAIVGLGEVLQLWLNWHVEQRDPEFGDSLRRDEQQTNSLFAILCCAALVCLIAVIDFMAPANINLAILYPIPLFVCAWTGNRWLLWSVLALLLALSACAFLLGPPPTNVQLGFTPQRNRILTAIGLVLVSLVLDFWMGRENARAE